ncbi:triphosphoribosyl-dephospho-CoA synthase [Lacticaseibacillus manihotivorans]|uniref:Probable 2-(5''-triphosphoribosyl)-3'-dephosphocoenzyme-A synthase n=2 Tax=Lacticaseibacillus manihotivorans TaxID=88233 RepID=A0A0R1R8L0_9LACO|nr:triphosphoribosyl-dephospho-CoA synthase [Lacticaseibacillus manihotivorans]KRL53423.1 2-(5-triphosphoribosyl)-3-dephosphocoenzyme-a synthase [Lacticaseibacillus manihotivorans DSM 13343 = JCM 12514]QFQ90654.1 triphosphoribosyl-dephospho-CoA synthase [Lacticaseibacillus manihotivorans]
MKPEELARLATRALLYEVSVNPKPGLVDPVTSGPHPDMSVFTFIDSSLSLQPYLTICAQAGDGWVGTLPELFASLRRAGITAEREMFAATNGVNTHKGAVFSLGILAAAVAFAEKHADVSVQGVVQGMLAGLCEHDFAGVKDLPKSELTAGETLYVEHGLTGVRGEAESGYSSVFDVGLPAFKASSGTLNERLLDTLMAIVTKFTDTNLIHRAGTLAILPKAQAQAQAVLDAGGAQSEAGRVLLDQMNDDFSAQNLSLGGSADMLILTIFMALVEGDL